VRQEGDWGLAIQQAETTYYNENGVLITNTRAVLGGTTYPLVNISSVGVGRQVPSGTTVLVLVILAIVGLMCGLSVADYRIAGLVGAVVFGLLAVLAYRNQKPSYFVSIGSAGGEQRALFGRSKAEVEKIVAALNLAIVARG
jgi:hypothetical protein